MKYIQRDLETMVVVEPAAASIRPIASIVWMHGLGADGHDFVPVVPELRLPDSLPVRFVFPHAPRLPVTVNNGYIMPAWYDIKVLGADRMEGTVEEDAAGIRQSEQRIRRLLHAEHEAGAPYNKIVLAGFSQGGAIALQTALRFPERLAGLMPLSTYLPLRDTLAGEASAANRDVPILMCHGRQDPVVPLAMGQRSRDLLQSLGYTLTFREYDMPHAVCADEIQDISRWLQQVLS